MVYAFTKDGLLVDPKVKIDELQKRNRDPNFVKAATSEFLVTANNSSGDYHDNFDNDMFMN